ncbi:MAG TPA: succinate--CoA ligase subunit alpha [Syntrophorhabdaceae bacterium]|jgi:succinyl-CoA synthetase alpha subunit|nr:succinate--CoA ligase subunit alpha [Syntrophorhabdaceae bacterium]MDI9560283.1 succinate--CoA ligase subunit alpha [Pseudomonadota bacterium]OQC47169.1 MAG: Succinyl-CoA ligase (ADP-forming) subunit alpha [Deltaproteobacteria bacterium ADurb.Bin026]MBV6505066.1 Succinate--CoA ligase [ADP-forming] subunit alpha [Syntrophorhabdaceae bacterium]HNQ63812.1 succinate--CoA ligase subunit alpha [Syntrophorhabdaceae bacterium]
MSIIVDQNTKVLVQGITGNEGAFHTRQMLDYGTNVVAGVTPGKGSQKFDGIPIFNTVVAAVNETGANASAIFVPPAFAADAVLEAVEAGIEIVVCLTEGIPTIDMITVRHYMKDKNAVLIGPNTPGIISPGKCKIGVMAGYIHKEGNVGIISRSGTLTYEVVDQLTKIGIGQSTCIGIGGDPIIGLKYVDLLEMFEKDNGTDAVVIIGEIGGQAEEQAAAYFKENMKKPVVAFIAGVTAPPGRRMGHAGAIVSGGVGDAATKIKTLEAAGIRVVKNPSDIGKTVSDVLF